ncbi:MAG TPA: hypothetical protein P5120_09155 [Spirochaetota bacterium]|nr:hypothetical protein [Spirochaetota bacterium]HPJ41386.1 hypothetical protein [Spirochaetota bacterium]HPR38144.1 hypothetical protein [Spirochaetota bacterium]HRX47675.1 hypothetical protein [Spirochaetota bacterium]
MSLNLIIILIFIAAMFFIAILYRNSTLDKLPMLPGETVIFEEKSVRVEQAGSPRSTIFINCIVRVTDRRIIVAQKLFLRKDKYALRHVISYSSGADETDLKTTFAKGYLNFSVRRDDVKIEREGEKDFIRIDIPESVLTRRQYVRFSTSFYEEFEKIAMS